MDIQQEVRDRARALVELLFPDDEFMVMNATTVAQIMDSTGGITTIHVNSVQTDPILRAGLAVAEMVAAIRSITTVMGDVAGYEDDDGDT
jgi:hypothetical protein